MSEYLTMKQAADMYDVSTRTVRRWIDEGLIKADRIGPRLLRVHIDSISGVYTQVPSKISDRRIAKSSQQRTRGTNSYWKARAFRELQEESYE